LSHTIAIPKGATVQVRFAFTAPAVDALPDGATGVTLYASGMATDLDGSTSGDNWAKATLAIGVGFSPVDMMPDAVSSATPPPGAALDAGAKPAVTDETHWACRGRVGGGRAPAGRRAAGLVGALALAAGALRRRPRRGRGPIVDRDNRCA